MKQNTAKVTEESRLKTPVADVVRLRLGWLSSWWGQEIMDGMLHRGFVKQKTIWLYNRSWRLKPWELPFEAFMWEVHKIRPVIDFLYDFGVVFVRMKLQQRGSILMGGGFCNRMLFSQHPWCMYDLHAKNCTKDPWLPKFPNINFAWRMCGPPRCQHQIVRRKRWGFFKGDWGP